MGSLHDDTERGRVHFQLREAGGDTLRHALAHGLPRAGEGFAPVLVTGEQVLL